MSSGPSTARSGCLWFAFASCLTFISLCSPLTHKAFIIVVSGLRSLECDVGCGGVSVDCSRTQYVFLAQIESSYENDTPKCSAANGHILVQHSVQSQHCHAILMPDNAPCKFSSVFSSGASYGHPRFYFLVNSSMTINGTNWGASGSLNLQVGIFS